MTYRSDMARGRKIVERWCSLAEQRLDYLTDLFETGRWRRYHTELAFLDNIQEAKTAVETWRTLLHQEASLNNSPVDTSWLDHKPPPPRPASILRDDDRPALPRSLQLAAARVEPEPVVESAAESPVPAAIHAIHVALTVEQDAASTIEDRPWERGLDLSAMQQRYPLLRNAL